MRAIWLLLLVVSFARPPLAAADPPDQDPPAVPRAQDATSLDLLIRGGRVLDGSGNPWVRADIGVRAGRIVALGRLGERSAARVIEAADRYVAPGFIDVHSHAAGGLAEAALSHARPLLAQGITTIVANPDGGGPIDLEAQRAALEADGLGVNVAQLIGHASVRREVLGMDDRPPDPAELERMRALVRRGMAAGAYGLSSGLFYAPGSYAETAELIALAEEVAPFGGLYTSHIRDESDYTVGLLASVSEVIRIAESAGIRGIVSHMKALGPDNWGLAVAATTRIERARARGIEVFADQYPYAASSTSLTGALVPRWAQIGGQAELARRIAEPDTRARLLDAVRENIRRRGGPASLVIARFEPNPGLEGQHLAQIADAGGAPVAEAALDLIAEGGASIVSFNMSEIDLEHIMRQPYTMTSSDGGLVPMGRGRPHPRNYGTYPRKLGRYVRDQATLSLESAVRSMTSLPALVFEMRDRGLIRVGAWADLVVFDLARLRDRATYTEPHQLAEGMDWVVVNGAVAVADGEPTATLAGRVLRKDR